AGLITLLRTLPTIFSALRSGLKDVRAEGAGQSTSSSRIDRDVSMRWVILGSIVIIAMMWVLLTFHPMKGANTQWYHNLLAGILSTIAIGTTLNLMNRGLEKYIPTEIPVNLQTLPEGVKVESNSFIHQGKTYVLINSLSSHEIPDGEYLYDPSTKKIEFQWAQGIGSDKAPAPQARLMATVIHGILNQRLPWRLVLMGVALVIAVEVLGVRSLAFA